MTPKESQRAERSATSIANMLWGHLSAERIEVLVEWPTDEEVAEALAEGDEDPRGGRTLWQELVSWVYTMIAGDPGKHVDLLHNPPADQTNARGGR